METVENLLTTVCALRVPLVLAVLAIWGGFYAAGILDRRTAA